MGIIERVLGWSEPGETDDSEAPYRCIACGAGHDRPYAECPECGGQFVAAADGQGEPVEPDWR
ncbi:MAG: hypothetical protein ABEH77_07620 [Halobacteriaceae archaeon]